MNKVNKISMWIVIAILILAIAKFSGFFSIENIGCGSTTYSSAFWTNNILTYTGVFGGSQLCGGESSSPRGGTTFTLDHHYGGGWNGAPLLAWENPSEPNSNFNYPPVAFVTAYSTPEEAATHMSCRVIGSVIKFGNYWGDVANVNIPYDVAGKEVKWLDSNRGFACIVDVPSFTSPISQGTPVIQGNVEFTLTLPEETPVIPPIVEGNNLNIIMYSVIGLLIVLIIFFTVRRK